MNNAYIVTYNSNGVISGLYDDIEVVKELITDNSDLKYNYLTDEMHEYIMSNFLFLKIKTDLISNSDVVLDASEYFINKKSTSANQPSFSKIKYELKQSIQSECDNYKQQGLYLILPYGLSGMFSYTPSNITTLLAILSGDKDATIYYKPDNQLECIYTYDEISYIYNQLTNNSIYISIYNQVMQDWIDNNYTEEMYNNNEVAITFGYSNDEIIEEVNRQYELQKLS
jgi:hypothetical protein